MNKREREMVRRVAHDLHAQADEPLWGSQQAVARWLRVLARRLDELLTPGAKEK